MCPDNDPVYALERWRRYWKLDHFRDEGLDTDEDYDEYLAAMDSIVSENPLMFFSVIWLVILKNLEESETIRFSLGPLSSFLHRHYSYHENLIAVLCENSLDFERLIDHTAFEDIKNRLKAYRICHFGSQSE